MRKRAEISRNQPLITVVSSSKSRKMMTTILIFRSDISYIPQGTQKKMQKR
jgi:hypothetical protein